MERPTPTEPCSLKGIPREVIERVQQDLKNPDFRRKVAAWITRINTPLEIALLSGAKNAGDHSRDLTLEDAYLLGAYSVAGAELAMEELGVLRALLDPTPQDTHLAINDVLYGGGAVAPPAA